MADNRLPFPAPHRGDPDLRRMAQRLRAHGAFEGCTAADRRTILAQAPAWPSGTSPRGRRGAYWDFLPNPPKRYIPGFRQSNLAVVSSPPPGRAGPASQRAARPPRHQAGQARGSQDRQAIPDHARRGAPVLGEPAPGNAEAIQGPVEWIPSRQVSMLPVAVEPIHRTSSGCEVRG
jgi:hypothetical protein